jgi:hypothetical protein
MCERPSLSPEKDESAGDTGDAGRKGRAPGLTFHDSGKRARRVPVLQQRQTGFLALKSARVCAL